MHQFWSSSTTEIQRHHLNIWQAPQHRSQGHRFTRTRRTTEEDRTAISEPGAQNFDVAGGIDGGDDNIWGTNLWGKCQKLEVNSQRKSFYLVRFHIQNRHFVSPQSPLSSLQGNTIIQKRGLISSANRGLSREDSRQIFSIFLSFSQRKRTSKTPQQCVKGSREKKKKKKKKINKKKKNKKR